METVPSTATTNPADAATLVVRRAFDYPAEVVYDAWLDPAGVGTWLFKTPDGVMKTVEIDPRVGGRFNIVETRNGKDAVHVGTYVELDRPRRLAFDFGDINHPESATRVTIDIESRDNGCFVTLTHQLDAAWLAHKPMAQAGWTGILEGLADRLDTTLGGEDVFTISRLLDAPRDLVWAAWTEEKRLVDWFGPKGVPIVKACLDFRPGGTFHYCMRTPDGGEMWGLWRFQSIDAPLKIVLLHSFSDADGNITRAPFNKDWPLETLSTTVFAPMGSDKTRVTLRWKPVNATAAEQATFKAGFAGMTGGWGGTFDLLAEYLAKQQA